MAKITITEFVAGDVVSVEESNTETLEEAMLKASEVDYKMSTTPDWYRVSFDCLPGKVAFYWHNHELNTPFTTARRVEVRY